MVERYHTLAQARQALKIHIPTIILMVYSEPEGRETKL